ncbi:MAG: IS3 family transposase [Bacillota bacterium]|nr:IS3 family transposase [Bacillota bacterium]
MGVSRSGYYAWLTRPESNRASNNNKLLKEIRRVYIQSCKTYGSPRIIRKLQKDGINCGKNRVARLMSSHGIFARSIDHERIYQETLRQVIAGEADHLDELYYDPVIL